MEHTGKFFQTLSPLLIFLVWLIISALANSKKKQPAQNPSQRIPLPSESSDSSPKETGKQTGYSEEIRKTLETVFGEYTGKPEQETETKDTETYESTKSPETTEEPVSYERPLPQSSKEEVQATTVSEVKTYPSVILEQKTESASPVDQTVEKERSTSILSHDDLRKAILWSEILSPPLALRE